MEADKLTISFWMFPIICIIFSHAYLFYFVSDSIASIFLIFFCSLFFFYFFSLDKIALHLSVNILSFLYWSGKFCFFLFFFWIMKFYFSVYVHTFLTLKFQIWAHISARIGLNRSVLVQIAAAPFVQVQPNVSQPTSLIQNPLHLLYWLPALHGLRFCFFCFCFCFVFLFFFNGEGLFHNSKQHETQGNKFKWTF